MNPEAMAAGGWSIGDRVDAIRLFRTSDFDEQGNIDPTKGEQLEVTIVGVAQRPDELIDDTEIRAPQVYLFPAFGRAHPHIGYYMIDYIRLVHGAADEAAFQQGAAAVSASSDSDPLQISSMTEAVVHADQARRPLVVAVWMLAAVLFAAALIFSALSIARSLTEHYRDLPVLRALGLSRGAIGLVITMHAMTIAIVAALVAMVIAWRPPSPHRSARPARSSPIRDSTSTPPSPDRRRDHRRVAVADPARVGCADWPDDGTM